ncbi:hypothetical protein NC651_005129 [Populus alba x Populus x berolinensis]|nr:hypothetical protein NC651_005129 [Populus alba x Populus x berolinensis]
MQDGERTGVTGPSTTLIHRVSPSPVQGTRRSHYHTKRHVAKQERKIAGGNGPAWREYDVAKLHLSNSRQKNP